MDVNELLAQRGLTVADLPEPLVKLSYFQETISEPENYVDGFSIYFADPALNGYSTDTDFAGAFLSFATANGSGSSYALWDDGTGKAMDDWPVIVFGDEGGVHVVAENVLGLLHLLSYDCEISVDWDEAYFYKDDDDFEPSEDIDGYLDWIRGDYGLDPIEDPAELIARAQARYKASFDGWSAPYLPQ
ncbi:MAG: hypothetical protein ACK5H2_10445 [Beutenbergiaceae bacterium]